MTGYEWVAQLLEQLDREGTGDLPAIVEFDGKYYRPEEVVDHNSVDGYATFTFEVAS